MSEYAAPLDDILFALDGLVDFEGLTALEPYGHVDADGVAGLLEEFGRLMAEVWGPTNQLGDEVGSHVDGDRVVVPAEYVKAYDAYVEALTY